MTVTFLHESEIPLTPEIMARAFWAMTDVQQVQFFKSLHEVIELEDAKYASEVQWHFLEGTLREGGNEDARAMLMTMAAPLYLHTIREGNLSV